MEGMEDFKIREGKGYTIDSNRSEQVKERLRGRLLSIVENNSKTTDSWVDGRCKVDNIMNKSLSDQDAISKAKNIFRNK